MICKPKEKFLIILRVSIALILFISAVVNYDTLTKIDVRLLVESASSVFVSISIILGVYALKSILFVIPAMLIYISVGLSFDLKTALIVNFFGIVIEIILTYFLGRILGGDYVKKMLQKNKAGNKLLNMKQGNKSLFLLSVRFLPIFPIDFTSLFLGASKSPFVRYFIFSVLGIFPRVALFTILGDGIYKYIKKEFLITLIIAAMPTVLIIYLIKIFSAQKKNKENECEIN